MTAEIALLNRSAIALAADSASTLTYWQSGRLERRFLKGANKIYNISDKHPIGLMIYDAGNLQGVPWEVIAKAYRDDRGAKSKATVRKYADDFFDFIRSEKGLFPEPYQERQLVERVGDAVLRFARASTFDENNTSVQDEALIRERFDRFVKLEEAAPYFDGVTDAVVTAKAARFEGDVFKDIAAEPVYLAIRDKITDGELFTAASRAVFKPGWTTLQKSGLVLVGFGDAEFFPHLHHFECHGVLLGTLLCRHLKTEDVEINHSNVSEIKPIAQSDMVKTFMYGASPNVLQEFDKLFDVALDGFASNVNTKAGGALGDLAAEKDLARTKFREGGNNYLWDAHTEPLRGIIGMLSIDELAALAETLISIESLKERVTRPTESVSGPIDVAVISKSDGFIWIKRKHYFDPGLNPRYLKRKGR